MTIENVHFDQINGSTPGVNVANGSNINVRNCKFTEKPSNSAFAITLTAGALSANIEDNDLSWITRVDKIKRDGGSAHINDPHQAEHRRACHARQSRSALLGNGADVRQPGRNRGGDLHAADAVHRPELFVRRQHRAESEDSGWRGSHPIRLGATVSAAAGFAQSNAIGATARLVAVNPSEWMIVSTSNNALWTVT